MKRSIPNVGLLVFAIVSVGWDCGDGGTTANPNTPNNATAKTPTPTPAGTGGLVWEQTFGTWTCKSAGRDDFVFDLIRKGEFTSHHDWVDHSTQTTLEATVDLTNLYLLKADGTSQRNFEYKEVTQGTLDHLEEWSLQAGANDPYVCRK